MLVLVLVLVVLLVVEEEEGGEKVSSLKPLPALNVSKTKKSQ